MRRGFALAPLVALLVAGCGGDDGPTRQEFAADANKVCTDIERQSEQLGEAQPDSVAEIGRFADRAEKTVQDGVSRLEKIERPSGDDGKKAKEFVDALKSDVERELVPALRDLKTAANEKDAKGLRSAAAELQKIDTSRSDKLAKDLGATACAE